MANSDHWKRQNRTLIAQAGIGSLYNRSHQGPEIRQGRVELHVVRRGKDEATVLPHRFEPFRDFPANLGGRSKGQGALLVDGSPEAELVSKFAFELSGVHGGGLDG